MRRVPIWTTLLPLVAGLSVYWWYWDQQHDAFRAGLERVLDRGQAIEVGGFPYRLEATLGPVTLRREGQDWFIQGSAAEAIVNRQPWRPDPTIIRLRHPQFQLAVPSVTGARLDVEGAASETSLRWNGDRIARLSTAVQDAGVWFALLPAPATAGQFELHFRETPATLDPASRAPTYPEQAQLVLAGEALRFGNGDPLTFAAEAGLTAAMPVRSLAAWQTGGTIELKRLTLSDKTGEVLSMTATLVPGSDGRPRVAGTVETVCPVAVLAAFRGRQPTTEERRTRKPVRLAFEGMPGDFDLIEPAAATAKRPVRGQEPPCPLIRR